MLTDNAFELIKELQRAPQTIPYFNDDLVRKVLEEIKTIFDENCRQATNYSSSGNRMLWPLLKYRHAALLRNRRCLLTYLHERLVKIKTLRWEFGPIIPKDIKQCLCEPEILWFNNYTRSLGTYMLSIGEEQGLDLTADLKPPKSLYVEVRCLDDHGKLELEDGEVIHLKKNSQHYLPRAEVETLIRQGVLQHIS